MAQVNVVDKEILIKIVYYGPALSGKTTNLEYVNKKIAKAKASELLSISTEGDRTLFFDFLPIQTNIVPDFNTKFQLYTVPGQVHYNATRRLVLQGVDGIVFVADSQWNKQSANAESFDNMRQNLADFGIKLQDMPYVLQYNKRDLDNLSEIEAMEKLLNSVPNPVPSFQSVAIRGDGVFDTLNAICRICVKKLLHDIKPRKR
ncbi:MAG: GTP-binding protein [bacterium]